MTTASLQLQDALVLGMIPTPDGGEGLAPSLIAGGVCGSYIIRRAPSRASLADPNHHGSKLGA